MCALGMCAFARLASAKNGCIRVLLAEASCALLGYRHWRKVGLGILGQIYLCACIKYLGMLEWELRVARTGSWYRIRRRPATYARAGLI